MNKEKETLDGIVFHPHVHVFHVLYALYRLRKLLDKSYLISTTPAGNALCTPGVAHMCRRTRSSPACMQQPAVNNIEVVNKLLTKA